MTRLRQRMLDDLRRRNYSADTIRGYIRSNSLPRISAALPNTWVPQSCDAINSICFTNGKLALGTVENCISALRFLYKKTLKRRDLAFDDLPFPSSRAPCAL
jgi:integrase/recombinase XerD